MNHFHIRNTGDALFDAVTYSTWTSAAIAVGELTFGRIEPCACEAGRRAIEGERADTRSAGVCAVSGVPSSAALHEGSALGSDRTAGPASPPRDPASPSSVLRPYYARDIGRRTCAAGCGSLATNETSCPFCGRPSGPPMTVARALELQATADRRAEQFARFGPDRGDWRDDVVTRDGLTAEQADERTEHVPAWDHD